MLFFEELCSRLDIDWDDVANNDLFTETELARWLTMARDEAVARHSWPLTEGYREIAAVANQEKYDYPTTLKSDSIRYLTVNGKKYEKLLFEEYLEHLEDYTSCAERIFTDRARTLYINYLATDFANSIVVYGQVEVTGSISSASTTSVFTTAEPEGDEAIIKLAYAKALGSDKLKDPNKGLKESTEAFSILDGIWERIMAKRHTYKTKDRALFQRVDVVGGRYEDELYKRNQF